MKFAQMKPPSKYLAKEDIDAMPNKAALVTIRAFTQENIAMKDKPPEFQWVMWVNEFNKGLILKTTNRLLLCGALGIDPNDEGGPERAVGQQVVLWSDMSVIGPNNSIGGLRIRQVKRRGFTPRPEAALQTPVPPAPTPTAGALRTGVNIIPGGGNFREPAPPANIMNVPNSVAGYHGADQGQYQGEQEGDFDDDIPF